MNAGEAIAWLQQKARRSVLQGMARYGIPQQGALGVPVGTIRTLGKQLGRDHALAQQLWDSGVYEARLLAAFVADPAALTVRQMNAWTAAFDSWAVCDTACFHLFDRSSLAWARVPVWAKSPREFTRRAGFALLASLALHDKGAADAAFMRLLPLIERHADDGRNFVKKAVSWALRGVGKRNAALHAAAAELATRLAGDADPTRRWIGKDALRDLGKPPRPRRKVPAPAKRRRTARG